MLGRRPFIGLPILLVALLAWGCSSSGDESAADQPAAALVQPGAVTAPGGLQPRLLRDKAAQTHPPREHVLRGERVASS